ncbi:MAG: hypothetical protein JST40_02185 [Armatimonadetes bacterium]|nr:hypothetical protein [Armatimonadota bacterium]
MEIENNNEFPESDPRHHMMKIGAELKGLAEHAREDMGKIDDLRGKVLLETTAEVLLGLAKAHDDFVAGEEEGMRLQ